MMCINPEKIDAGYATDDTSVEATNIEPSMAPSNSALETGLVTMLLCYVIVSSVCCITILLRGAMSAVSGRLFFLRDVDVARSKEKSCGQPLWNSYVEFRPISRQQTKRTTWHMAVGYGSITS